MENMTPKKHFSKDMFVSQKLFFTIFLKKQRNKIHDGTYNYEGGYLGSNPATSNLKSSLLDCLQKSKLKSYI